MIVIVVGLLVLIILGMILFVLVFIDYGIFYEIKSFYELNIYLDFLDVLVIFIYFMCDGYNVFAVV